MVRVKICGITNAADARHAVRSGADALGFVFAKSPRRVSAETARKITGSIPADSATVGVFVDEPAERLLRIAERCRLTVVQLHGDEKPSLARRLQKNGLQVLKALRVGAQDDLDRMDDWPADALLFDTSASGRFGGTGRTFDWGLLAGRRIRLPWFVSGGLNPGNVKKLLSALQPYGVDVSSGVEISPGKKSAALVREFIKNAKSTG